MKKTADKKTADKKSSGTSHSLWTDLYQITTAAAYFINRVNVRASFELYIKTLPQSRTYLIAAGMEQVVDYLRNLRFTQDDVEYLRSLPNFASTPDDFFAFLGELRFTGDLWSIPEGTPFFAGEPILRVSAPIIEAQIVESYILSVVNYQVTVASKAARIVEAARGKKVIDFGFRRAPAPEAAHYASRAAYIAGFDATSNLEGGRRYGIPMIGTVPYSFVLAFQSEQDAMKQYARAFPEGALVLIDTVNQEEATREVIACGEKLRGVRISSGELLKLSKDVRAMLDGANHQSTEIIASGDLNEEKISSLVESDAPIDCFGVGADLVAAKETAVVEGIYRLVEVEEKSGVRYPEKFFAGKETIPARKQILRKVDRNGRYRGDAVARAGEVPAKNEVAYLRKVMEGGKLVAPLPPLGEIRKYCMEEIMKLPHETRRIAQPEPYPVKLSRQLLDLCARVTPQK